MCSTYVHKLIRHVIAVSGKLASIHSYVQHTVCQLLEEHVAHSPVPTSLSMLGGCVKAMHIDSHLFVRDATPVSGIHYHLSPRFKGTKIVQGSLLAAGSMCCSDGMHTATSPYNSCISGSPFGQLKRFLKGVPFWREDVFGWA